MRGLKINGPLAGHQKISFPFLTSVKKGNPLKNPPGRKFWDFPNKHMLKCNLHLKAVPH